MQSASLGSLLRSAAKKTVLQKTLQTESLHFTYRNGRIESDQGHVWSPFRPSSAAISKHLGRSNNQQLIGCINTNIYYV